MYCPECGESLYNTYECDNCGYDCEDDLIFTTETENNYNIAN